MKNSENVHESAAEEFRESESLPGIETTKRFKENDMTIIEDESTELKQDSQGSEEKISSKSSSSSSESNSSTTTTNSEEKISSKSSSSSSESNSGTTTTNSEEKISSKSSSSSSESNSSCDSTHSEKIISTQNDKPDTLNLFQVSKIDAKESIFLKQGTSKIKKTSEFLQINFKEPAIQEEKQEQSDIFKKKCRLCYLEDEEWIDVGIGEFYLKDDNVYFVRDMLKTIILTFPAHKTPLEKNKNTLIFTAKSRKSQGEGFELVNRKYKAEFSTVESLNTLLLKIE
ncbi:hypothetical protein GINT2_002303 [Glugoides intestinalis]